MDKPILRALSIPELLDKTLQLYKRHALVLMGIFAVIMIPIIIVQSVLTFYLPAVSRFGSLVTGIMEPFAQIAIIVAISDFYLGNSAAIFSSLKKGTRKYWSYIGSSILIGLAMIPAGLIFFLFSLGGGPLMFIGFLIFIPVVVYLSTRWGLVMPAIVIEDLGASKGLERSWSLTNGYFWRVLGTSVAAGLLAYLFAFLPSTLTGFILERMANLPSEVVLVATSVTAQLATIVTAPLTLGVNVLIYYDLRIRKEGFDLLFAAEAEEQPEGAVTALDTNPPPA